MTLQIRPPSDWLTSIGLLARIHPPHSVVYVGSQPSSAPSQVWQQWGVKNAVLIDPLATESPASNLPAGWLQIPIVLGVQPDDGASFYRLSLSAESGLLPADALRTLWSNIQLIYAEKRAVVTLDNVLANLPDPQPAPDWLVVDSLPALNVLQGAVEVLETVQVIHVRVMLKSTSDHPSLEPCCLDTVSAFMNARGYICAAVVETRHPALGMALFVRDFPGELRQHHGHLSEARQALQQALSAEAQARAGLAEQLTLSQEKVQQLGREKAAQDNALKAAQHKVAELTQQLQVTQQKVCDIERQLAAEAQARAELAEQLTASQEEAQQLLQEKAAEADALKAERDNSAELTQHLQVSQQKVGEMEQQLAALEIDNREQAHRQNMLKEELVKAEEQTELIIDLLLSQPGLRV